MNDRVPFQSLPLVLRMALRDLRGGLRGFAVFLACIALGVAAISGVSSLSLALNDGLSAQGRTILGGDISFNLVQRPLTSAERAYFESHARLSSVALLRAMARNKEGETALVELKAVGASYPEQGAIGLEPPHDLVKALELEDGIYGLAADAALAGRLSVKLGDRLKIGDQDFRLAAILTSEPDKLAGGIGFGPRVIVSVKGLQAAGLLAPGSLVKWLNRVTLDDQGRIVSDAEVSQFIAAAQEQFPQAGWEIRTRKDVSPQFTKNIERFSQFLTLIGLTTLIIGGVGIANAIRAFVSRKTVTIAILKSVGASGSLIFTIMLVEAGLIALLGLAIGAATGSLIPFVAARFLSASLGFELSPSIYPSALGLGCLYGLLTAIVFSVWALGRAHDIPATALFRHEIEPRGKRVRLRYVLFSGAAALLLASSVVIFTNDRKLALIYLGATLASFAILGIMAGLIMTAARLVPRPENIILRLAIANIYRPNALTTPVVLSLGLGLALLVALSLIDGNLSGEINHAQPGKTPSFYFIGIESGAAQPFAEFIKRSEPDGTYESVPMLRGRIVRLNGVPVQNLHPKESAAWVLDGDRGVTFSAAQPDGIKLAAGSWWRDDYEGPPLVSMESEIAQGLGLKLGEELTVNILGRDVTAKLANTRAVNWRGMGINFVLIFSPHGVAEAPHGEIATLTFKHGFDPAREAELMREAAQKFPSVTTIRVKDVLDSINTLLSQIATAIRAASSIALLVSVLVLGGALASGQQARVHDAIVLKTLGATRAKLIAAFTLEYGLIGFATALFGLAAGGLAAYFISIDIMHIEFNWLWPQALLILLLALAITISIGLFGSWEVLGRKPAAYLRDL